MMSFNELRRHMLHEPHTVCRKVELVACPVHVAAANDQDDWPTAALADFAGRLGVGREVYVMTLPFVEPCPADGFHEAVGRTVIKKLRRSLRLILQVHFKRVALAGADTQAILAEGKSPFVVRGDDVFQSLQCEGDSMSIHDIKQFANTGPAGLVEFEPDTLRLVPENQAEELAGSDGFFLVHARLRF